jgi:hypothetical protein
MCSGRTYVGKKIRSPKMEIVRHEPRITRNGCWEWQGSRDYAGYGTLYILGKTYRVSREWWRLHYGAIPAGMFICHHCDNPPCYNIAHLYLGTPATNKADSIARGRSSRQRFTSLSAEDINDIRDRISHGVPIEVLASELKISRPRLMRIARGKEQPTKPPRRPKDK